MRELHIEAGGGKKVESLPSQLLRSLINQFRMSNSEKIVYKVENTKREVYSDLGVEINHSKLSSLLEVNYLNIISAYPCRIQLLGTAPPYM